MGLFTWREMPRWIIGIILLLLISLLFTNYKSERDAHTSIDEVRIE